MNIKLNKSQISLLINLIEEAGMNDDFPKSDPVNQMYKRIINNLEKGL